MWYNNVGKCFWWSLLIKFVFLSVKIVPYYFEAWQMTLKGNPEWFLWWKDPSQKEREKLNPCDCASKPVFRRPRSKSWFVGPAIVLHSMHATNLCKMLRELPLFGCVFAGFSRCKCKTRILTGKGLAARWRVCHVICTHAHSGVYFQVAYPGLLCLLSIIYSTWKQILDSAPVSFSYNCSPRSIN